MEDFDACCFYLSMEAMPQRERSFYREHNSEIDIYMPEFYGTVDRDDSCLLLMEDLSYCKYMDQIRCPEVWGIKEVTLAVKALAFLHNRELCKKDILLCSYWKADYNRIAVFLESMERNLITYSGMERIAAVDQAAYRFIFHLEKYEGQLNQYGKRMIHHDFNIRNICIDIKRWQLKVYDWEFIDYKNPIIDLVDLFLSLSSNFLNQENLDGWLKIYINEAMKYGAGGRALWEIKEQLYYNILKFSATRMNMYLLFYARVKDSYMERMYRNLFLLLKYCGTREE